MSTTDAVSDVDFNVTASRLVERVLHSKTKSRFKELLLCGKKKVEERIEILAE